MTMCADLKSGEKALIVSDEVTQKLGEQIAKAARQVTDRVTHRTIPPFRIHGEEPPTEIAALMLESDAIFGITRMSMAHSQARLMANLQGARYLSLPDYSVEVLAGSALQADFRGITALSNRLAEILTQGKKIRMKSASGSDLTCVIDGRVANAAPGWCYGPGTLASPPDAETNIAPIEDQSNGVLIVDGSIPCRELGLLHEPIELTVRNGRVTTIRGGRAGVLEKIFDHIGNPLTRVVAEFGIGLNSLAVLSGSMLEDEGCLGTAHIGIGSNATIGGNNRVPFHLDHIVRHVSIDVDGVPLMENGKIILEAFR